MEPIVVWNTIKHENQPGDNVHDIHGTQPFGFQLYCSCHLQKEIIRCLLFAKCDRLG